MLSITEQAARAAHQHAIAVEELCLQALQRGHGWRVWVGQGRFVEDASGARVVYDTMMLPPGASEAPGRGTIYGPFS